MLNGKSRDEMTLSELYWLLAEYERMLGEAREYNQFSREFRLMDMTEDLNNYIIERVGEEKGW